MFRKKIKIGNKERELSLDETKEYELHTTKIWFIKTMAICVGLTFMSIVGAYLYVAISTKEMNYIEALMTGMGSILSALTSIFGL